MARPVILLLISTSKKKPMICPVDSEKVVLKVWDQDQEHQRHPGTCRKCISWGPIPDPPNENLWGWAQQTQPSSRWFWHTFKFETHCSKLSVPLPSVASSKTEEKLETKDGKMSRQITNQRYLPFPFLHVLHFSSPRKIKQVFLGSTFIFKKRQEVGTEF